MPWIEPDQWPWLIAGATTLSLILLLAAVFGLPLVLARLPPDYFQRQRPSWQAHVHPLRRLLWLVARNVLGGVLIVLGIAMLVLPGQGLLTILAGLVLTTLPFKKRLALYLLRWSAIRRGVAWIRRRSGAEPLELPFEDDPPRVESGSSPEAS